MFEIVYFCGKPIPRLCLGLDYVDHTFSPLFLRKAVEQGVRCFDTASEYMQGQSEIVLGQSIKDQRHSSVIVTKFPPEHAIDIAKSCEQSLKRLDTDHIDLYLLHGYDPRIDLHDLINDLESLKKTGKILKWGVSNCSSEVLDGIIAISDQCYAHQIWHSPVVNKEKLITHGCASRIKPMVHSIFKNADRKGLWITDHAYQSYCLANSIDPAMLAISWACSQNKALPVVTTKNINHLMSNMHHQNLSKHYQIINELYGDSD